jgi:hypothetical protein
MKVFNPVSRINCTVRESETVGEHKHVIKEAGKNLVICDVVDCFAKATTTIEVEAGHHRTISLSLCNTCVNKFIGDD